MSSRYEIMYEWAALNTSLVTLQPFSTIGVSGWQYMGDEVVLTLTEPEPDKPSAAVGPLAIQPGQIGRCAMPGAHWARTLSNYDHGTTVGPIAGELALSDEGNGFITIGGVISLGMTLVAVRGSGDSRPTILARLAENRRSPVTQCVLVGIYAGSGEGLPEIGEPIEIADTLEWGRHAMAGQTWICKWGDDSLLFEFVAEPESLRMVKGNLTQTLDAEAETFTLEGIELGQGRSPVNPDGSVRNRITVANPLGATGRPGEQLFAFHDRETGEDEGDMWTLIAGGERAGGGGNGGGGGGNGGGGGGGTGTCIGREFIIVI